MDENLAKLFSIFGPLEVYLYCRTLDNIPGCSAKWHIGPGSCMEGWEIHSGKDMMHYADTQQLFNAASRMGMLGWK
jgi:hypothetical protein